ncbi:2OG-Fe dioxygenase family protein [Sessilibacter sp. MAH2]
MLQRIEKDGHTKFFYKDELTLDIHFPELDISQLQRSFDFVPYDNYYDKGSRYRTTSRVEITEEGYKLLPKVALYQPTYVNDIDSYGGIDRIYADVPISLLQTEAFDTMIKCWLEQIPFEVKSFSVHQIRTTDSGNPTPEGRHKDGTDWTGVYIVRRHNIEDESGKTKYWIKDEEVVSEVVPEGGLISHCDRYFLHCATPIEKKHPDEPSFRDVFVLTTPEHGLNREQEEYRAKVLEVDL